MALSEDPYERIFQRRVVIHNNRHHPDVWQIAAATRACECGFNVHLNAHARNTTHAVWTAHHSKA